VVLKTGALPQGSFFACLGLGSAPAACCLSHALAVLPWPLPLPQKSALTTSLHKTGSVNQSSDIVILWKMTGNN